MPNSATVHVLEFRGSGFGPLAGGSIPFRPESLVHWRCGFLQFGAVLIGSHAVTDTATAIDDPNFAERIRQRDPEALEAVTSAYLPQILRAARGAGLDPQRAEDLAQSTFTTFIEAAPRFEGRSHVRTWLFGILYKKIAEARRDEKRAGQLEDIDEVVEKRFAPDGKWAQPPRPVDARLYDAEIRGGIEECLEGLPTKQRMAFILREVQELESKEVCKILEVTVTNLGVLLYRARNRLRECLEAKGVRG